MRPSVALRPAAPQIRFSGDSSADQPPAPAAPAAAKPTAQKKTLRQTMNLLMASLVGAGAATGVGVVQNKNLHDSFQAQVAQVSGQLDQAQKGNQAALEGLLQADRQMSQALAGAIVPVDVMNKVARAGVRIEGAMGLGSGTFFRDNNNRLYILTNDHVVADNDMNGRFKVRLYSGTDETSTEVEAEVVRLSSGQAVQSPFGEGKDLAVLRVVEYPDRPAFVPPHALSASDFRDLSKEPLRAGEAVFAVGTPQGLNDVISRGVVSNAHRNVPWNPQVISIQIDAPVNPGNSGGALYDSQGRLIGVVNSSLIRRGADGLSFAISIESVKGFLNDNSIPVTQAPPAGEPAKE